MSQATIRIPAPLRPLAGGASEVKVLGETVGDALEALGKEHDGFLERILDGNGQLRAFVNIYLGENNIRSLDGLDSPVAEGATIHIVPAVAGGGAGQ